MDDEKIMDLMDKQDEILTKFNLLQKYSKENKQYYAQIEEGMDSMKENDERYYTGTIKKMGEYYSKLNASIQNIEVNVVDDGKGGGGGGDDSSFAAQLKHDMSTANMLSVMREEYNAIRREKDEMRKEVERYRKENETLSLEANKLKEEAINSREAKRRTVKNLIDEINTMRDQIFKISQGKIKNQNGFASSLSRHINL